MTISGHFSANCMFIFHKNEVQTVNLMYLTSIFDSEYICEENFQDYFQSTVAIR